ncbi:mRNA cleavage and polyadenylation factor CLP1 [Sphaceloma murrayae]|uniref:mRNA cleavage and polyadenylation factor CLP1 n=1 Tax=Sphaceloma murrayae TaxID=2082308 RepID=A0A2K1R0G8_9PEZI|nr:mRNA cleavage and polyadenylation factor CLP1 [Sphaceloma murrayae]
MKIEKIYVYPVKALQPVELPAAEATRDGFTFDRRFMLVKILPDGLKNIHVAKFPESVLFYPTIRPTRDDTAVDELTITYKAPNSPETSLTFPLTPVTDGLDTVDVVMHKAPTRGYDMGPECNDWFSECYGFPVKLLYLGDNRRNILMSTKTSGGAKQTWSSWVSGVIAGGIKDEITFADCAPYLVVSRTSLHNVSSRLSGGLEMDVTKFRPNIVVEGASQAWEEDYWGKLALGGIRLDLVHNCVRCKSINIDYRTGKPGEDEHGEVLKKLQSDRRVDNGAKWSPVFGRYSCMSQDSEETVIKVGDEVQVLERNAQRTVFDWPGLG